MVHSYVEVHIQLLPLLCLFSLNKTIHESFTLSILTNRAFNPNRKSNPLSTQVDGIALGRQQKQKGNYCCSGLNKKKKSSAVTWLWRDGIPLGGDDGECITATTTTTTQKGVAVVVVVAASTNIASIVISVSYDSSPSCLVSVASYGSLRVNTHLWQGWYLLDLLYLLFHHYQFQIQRSLTKRHNQLFLCEQQEQQ